MRRIEETAMPDKRMGNVRVSMSPISAPLCKTEKDSNITFANMKLRGFAQITPTNQTRNACCPVKRLRAIKRKSIEGGFFSTQPSLLSSRKHSEHSSNTVENDIEM